MKPTHPSKLPAKLRLQLEKANLRSPVQWQFPGLPAYETEYRFHPTRKWRMDMAWPALKIACEVEGGAWTNGRHTRGAGFIADMEKYNAAAILGWRIIRVTPQQVRNGTALQLMKDIITP